MIIKSPIATEKAIRLMELGNELVFKVDERATKKEVKDAVESKFKVKVVKIRLMRTIKGYKKAYVKLSEETPAIDVATRLKLT